MDTFTGQDDFSGFDFAWSPGGLEGGREDQLPFRLLVLGDFVPGQSQAHYERATPIPLGLRNFDRLLAAQNISLSLSRHELELSASCSDWFHPQEQDVTLALRSLEDFNPEMIAQRQPVVARIQTLLVKVHELKRAQSGAQLHRQELDIRETLSAWERIRLGLGPDQTKVSRDLLDFLLADLGATLNELLNRILHHPRLQQLEAAWRGLHLLAQAAADHPACQVCFLPVTRAHLQEDLQRAPELSDSHLFDVLYLSEYGQFGGKPYAAVIADYAFAASDEDIDLLGQLARLGQVAHAPVITQAAPAFFGLQDYAELAHLSSLTDLLGGERHLRWRNLQAKTEAIYLVLTLPRILLRNLYRMANNTVNATLYEEDTALARSPYLWGSAAYAFGTCLLRSFQQHGICTDITDAGGEVLGLPRPALGQEPGRLLPVEVLLSENREAELIRLGFTPLSTARAEERVLFHAANSVHWGCLQTDRSRVVIEHLGAQLPYLFVILRIAHYLKVICRDLVGSVSASSELESHLLRWVKRYVADVESPSQALRARRPLKKVSLVVRPDPLRADWLQIALSITPHLKYMGQEFTLNLTLAANGLR